MRRKLSLHAMRTCFRSLFLSSLLIVPQGATALAQDTEPNKAKVDVPADYRDPTPFAFQKGDVVAILGNGLPDRIQHDGWMETLLQSSPTPAKPLYNFSLIIRSNTTK